MIPQVAAQTADQVAQQSAFLAGYHAANAAITPIPLQTVINWIKMETLVIPLAPYATKHLSLISEDDPQKDPQKFITDLWEKDAAKKTWTVPIPKLSKILLSILMIKSYVAIDGHKHRTSIV